MRCFSSTGICSPFHTGDMAQECSNCYPNFTLLWNYFIIFKFISLPLNQCSHFCGPDRKKQGCTHYLINQLVYFEFHWKEVVKFVKQHLYKTLGFLLMDCTMRNMVNWSCFFPFLFCKDRNLCILLDTP